MYYKGTKGVIEWEGKMEKVRGRNCVFTGPSGTIAIETGQIVPENWGLGQGQDHDRTAGQGAVEG